MDVTQIIIAVGLFILLAGAITFSFINTRKLNKVKEERELMHQEYLKLRILEIKSNEKEVTHYE